MNAIRVPTFGGIQTGVSPLKIEDTRAFDCSNVRFDNPRGALNNDIGMSKKNAYGASNPIVAIHQLKNKRNMFLSDDSWWLSTGESSAWEDPPTYLGSDDVFVLMNLDEKSYTGLAYFGSDLYFSVPGDGLYKQTNYTSDPVRILDLSGGSFNIYHMDFDSTGRLWVIANDTGLSGQFGYYEAGTLTELVSPSVGIADICVTPSDDIYVTCSDGIFKKLSGESDFNLVAAGNWYSIDSDSSGNIFATTATGDIYKQTLGAGDFNIYATGVSYKGPISIAPNGDIYVCDYFTAFSGGNGTIYKQTAGTGDFIAINNFTINPYLFWTMKVVGNGNIYGTDYATSSDLWKTGNAT